MAILAMAVFPYGAKAADDILSESRVEVAPYALFKTFIPGIFFKLTHNTKVILSMFSVGGGKKSAR